jgi:hypothetical protein
MKNLICSIIIAASLSHSIAEPLTMSDAIVLQQLNSQYQQQPQQSSSTTIVTPSSQPEINALVNAYENKIRILTEEIERLKTARRQEKAEEAAAFYPAIRQQNHPIHEKTFALYNRFKNEKNPIITQPNIAFILYCLVADELGLTPDYSHLR